MIFVPTLSHGDVTVRSVRPRDARTLNSLLRENRSWLRKWEATLPGYDGPPAAGEMIRNVLRLARKDQVAPFVIEYRGVVVGQVTLSGLSFGSLASGAIGYWIDESVAGKGITPLAVALVIDSGVHQSWNSSRRDLHSTRKRCVASNRAQVGHAIRGPSPSLHPHRR